MRRTLKILLRSQEIKGGNRGKQKGEGRSAQIGIGQGESNEAPTPSGSYGGEGEDPLTPALTQVAPPPAILLLLGGNQGDLGASSWSFPPAIHVCVTQPARLQLQRF